jgi:hypothetical protein
VESYVHANDAGTLTAAREPPDTANDAFEATKEETVELRDGTEATLKYMEPTQVVNQGPFWEGSFEKEGYTYTLRVSLADPSGGAARQALSSMVEVPDETSAESSTESKRDDAENEGPAPGYNLIRAPDGGLAVEVTASWEVQTGANSEGEGTNWSYYAGESLTSSITTAPNLDAWYSTGTSGAYVVASKALTQYSDYELTHAMLFENKSTNCAQGPYEDYDRPPYSGKIQTWYDCGADGATTYSVAAAPEGRECVVVFDARISEEADREAIEHLVNSFAVDCGRVTSEPLASPTASASPSASTSPSASASVEVYPGGPAYNFIEVPEGTPPCPLGLDEVREMYGSDVECGEGGGYVPATGGR